MGLLGAIGLCLALVSLTQISTCSANACHISTSTAWSSSAIMVKWEQYPGATYYFLDLRVKNNSYIAPVVVTVPSTALERIVNGLRPGTEYDVILKVFKFFYVDCMTKAEAQTVPDTAQIQIAQAVTSTSIIVKWTEVPSAKLYYLQVISQTTGLVHNRSYTDHSAVVTNLQPSTNYKCYVITANEAGMGTESKVRIVTTLVEPPPGLTAIETGRGTARVTWLPVEDVLLYMVVIRDLDEPGTKPATYNVTDTRLDINGILPCSTYLISVSSFNKFLVPSEPTNFTYTTNKLTPVSSVTVDYTCTTHSAMVHWTSVFGAESYKAMAVAENGTKLMCTSQGTYCEISGLSCGESYMVHVTPVSESCTNKMNTTSVTFQTVPCPPKNLNLWRDCSSEVIIFSWERTNNTDHYMAKAVDSQGVVQECLTEDDFCYFTHTVCGRHYTFTVYSIAGQCKSQISSTVDIRTAPCIPPNLRTRADCGSDVLLSRWDLAEGALRYVVDAYGNKGTKTHYNCTSMSDSCVIQGVHCGEFLTVYITAYDDECSSPRSLGPVAETVPCAPQNVSAVKECGADAITVTWTGGSAIFYIAMAKDSNGVIYSCNAMDMVCKITGLKCSTNYTVSVIASNFNCNSTESETVTIETADCPPNHVSASLDCAANEALISWQGLPKMNSYTATIVDELQRLLSCSSTNTSCRIPNLKCGQLYTVTVSYHDGICPSMPSEAIFMASVPCGPEVTADLDCRSGELMVGWNSSSKAEGYMAVVSSGAQRMTYNTTEPRLKVDTLMCGMDYTLEVMSYNSSCVSHPSVVPVGKAPCVPTNVTANRNCGQSFVQVSWQASRGAYSYHTTAVDKDGKRLMCHANGTSCRLDGLMCSQVYSIRVAAVNHDCTSNESSAVALQTAPCPPSQLNASVNCANDSATLTWNSSPNAVSYTGKAVSTDGHTVTCDAGMILGCQLSGLHCGKNYSFTVSASDGGCQSADSTPVTLTTAPCAVQDVLNSLNCNNNTLTVSWMSGSMSTYYSATAVAKDGTALECITGGTKCMIPLQCGQQYNVTVRAVGDTCDGHSSTSEIVNAVPCVPAQVDAYVDCNTNMMHASWDKAAGAWSYVSMLEEEGGEYSLYTSDDEGFLFSDLHCAQTYMLSVMAVNDRCNSSKSATISAMTAPCDPSSLTADLHCSSGVVTVSWLQSAGAKYYTVLAGTHDHGDSCYSNGTDCELTDLRCGRHYTVTVLAGDGKCNSSFLAIANVTTAPCAPVILDHSLDCVTNHAVVTWVKDEDAMSVTVNATSHLGHSTSCSSSTNGTCVLDNLKCGHTYTMQAVARGNKCWSEPSAAFQVVTAPCTPANVQQSYSCETGIAFLSWDEALGREGFHAYIYSGEQAVSYYTDQTDMSMPSLLCGHMYYVEVKAMADHCNSSMSGMTKIMTAPCSPMNVSASLVCENDTAFVSWDPSAYAISYKVVANSRGGHVIEFTTNDTSCNLTHMHCAQTYIITVTPYSDNCKGQDSYPIVYVAGPCPPNNVHVSLKCEGNVGHVTWDPALQADHYLATAVPWAKDEYNHTCWANGTGCDFTDLRCGETAAVTVVTIERGCTSQPSLPFTFQSVICPPTEVTGETTCRNSDITVRWDPSPESGVEYFVHAQKEWGAEMNFSTTQPNHVLTGLQCGELYTLSVAAKDSECTSNLSKAIQTETAPCPPTNLTVRAECGTNLGNLTWSPSTHAISYTATVTGSHGHVVTCMSNTTTCAVKLDCGRHYTVFMVATSATCNSSRGETLSFDSAPCLPDNMVANLSCNANSFSVQWRGSVNDVGIYTALAIGSDESRASCEALTTNCTIEDLKCGLNYSIVITTASVDCGVIEGSDYFIMSAPCKPTDLSVNLQCSSNMALVTWRNSGPDQTQVVSAVDSRGAVTFCNSTNSNCTFDQLGCGETYAVSVVGRTDTCSSEEAVAQTLRTAPCVPTHLTAHVDCQTGITSVIWDAARGATSYTVHAHGSLGHNATCNNMDTNCNFLNLACGQDYWITVVAHHDSCSSLVSQSTKITSVPCPHSGLKTTLDCSTNTAVVSWELGSGIPYYNATAYASDVGHQQSCVTNGSSCNISSLHCGTSYIVRVSGQGGNCSVASQDWNRINTAPCPPTQLTVDSSCGSNNISVSWRASQGSFSYVAVAENEEGRRWSCNTNSSTTCLISALPCGQKFEVYAVGVDNMCTGAKSDVEVIRTAPCVPHNIQSDLDCLSGVLNVTWESTGYYVNFRTSVVSGDGHVNMCTGNEHQCVVRNMQCGQTYNVTVWAEDEACNSSYSHSRQVVTAPCPLTSFLSSIDCSTGVVSVSWDGGVAGVTYTVSAVDNTGRRHNCSGTTGGCDLTTLECGEKHNVTVTPSRSGCVGRDSPTEMIVTAPCVPHLSDVEIDCLTNSAWVVYEAAAGAEDYNVTVTDGQGDVQIFQCNATSEEVCHLPSLMCSKNITVTIQARDPQCSSAPSNAITRETAPCPPEKVETSVGCDNHSISVTWPSVPGAISYTATLEQIYGNTTCCMSYGGSCDIADLPCGEMYILHVVAEGRTCNSSENEGDIVRTVPCIPQDLKASLSCSDNVASMSWNHSRGAQFYTVTAVGEDGHEVKCVNHENKCDLTDLKCGQHYTATVTAEDIECQSKRSESVDFKTVPCTPENVSAAMDCESNAMVVYWSESAGSDSYIATVQDSQGQTTTCVGTTEGSCSVMGVGCGQVYHVTVVSSDGYCDSPPTTEVESPSAPCEAGHIEAELDCFTQMASVSWYPSDGAWTYEVTAKTASGHNVSCEVNTTHCYLEGLLCGQSYSVCVTAVGESCSSVAYMTGQLYTEPCVPEHISTQYGLMIGQVLWDMADGAEYYTVEGVTAQGLIVSCITNDTYCPLYNMACGQTYNISVAAHNHVCHNVSTSTEDVVIETEPCPPNNVQTSVQCQTGVGTVSFEASFGAVAYEAQLAGRDGHSLTCYSVDTFCNVGGLHCGTVYYTSVIAIGETLNSSASTTVLLVSAPCAAEDVKADLDCYNNSAEVSWSSAVGADSFTVMAVSANGHWATCDTEELWCYLTELQCGQTYNVSLTSISDHCQTETHTEVTFSSQPCKPVRVAVDLQCGTGTAEMSWEDAEGVETYTVTATSSGGAILKYNTTNSTLQVSDLLCGETYEFTVTAHSGVCSSEPSSSVEIRTEPCQPVGLTIAGSCDNETVVLGWSAADGASVYRVRVVGDLGHVSIYQTEDTTVHAELPCGQLYSFTVKARDDRCDSAESWPEHFKTGPCVPQHVESFTPCENDTASVSWAKSDGAESYMAIAMAQDGHTHFCTVNASISTCTWDDLHCGEIYTVHVIANDYLCSSMPSNSTTIRMAPCIPQNLEASLNCSSKFGALTWDPSETAEYYLVTAESNSGHKVQLSTNDTWTFISELMCGEEYFLSVQAADSECTSLSSQPEKLQTAPCRPTGVSSSMDCITGIALVQWTGSAGADFYTATVTHEDGETQSCSFDGEQCGMPNLSCGKEFTVTVVASNEVCSSDPSEPDTLKSVPCVPTDVQVSQHCSTNEAEVSWSVSEGALSYKVSAQSRQGDVLTCESSNLTSCLLPNLTCGQVYSIQVVAEDDVCSSLPSPPEEIQSAPCTPQIGSVVLDCITKSALLDWHFSEGAVFFVAEARCPGGQTSISTTNYTYTELHDLECGQTCEVAVMASNGMCSSPLSSTLQVETVPCPPEDVTPILDCSTNSARLEWQPGPGADSYIVQAVGMEEHETYCEAESGESCVLTDLMCGFTYNVSVIAVNSVCNVSQSDTMQLQAAPCGPQQVEARVVCESGAVAVSWEPSKGASWYTAVAQGNGGYASTHNSSGTTCLFSDLLCGHNYTITVTAWDDTCSSVESYGVEISTAPCVPQRVSAEMVCSEDTAVVSWEEEEDVSSHRVQAFGPDGHRTECNGTGSYCELYNMHCGQMYNLTVTAEDGLCDNSNFYLTLHSVPCKPTNVKADLLCHSNSAAVTWERASGAVSYHAVGLTEDGSHRIDCNNTVTHCDLSGLWCGQIYNVTVYAKDGHCNSMESDVAYVQTAPCPPQNLAVDAKCADGAMSISWTPNPDVWHFHAAAVSNTGARLYCNSSGSGCDINNLPCGQTYNITVISVRDDCESERSAVVETSSAPCVPKNVKGSLDCVSNAAWVTWDNSQGAHSYSVMAHGVGGHTSNCTSTSSPCSVPDLKCATLYTFYVTAGNKHCTSSNSTSFELETGPCALTSISAVTECNSSSILVEWEMADDTPVYVVTAEGHDLSIISCNSSHYSCELEDAKCGMQYSIIVATSSDKCSSLRSPPKKIKTAPCIPSNVTVVPSCEDQGALVTWKPSPVANTYMLTATGSDGHVASCVSNVNNCTLSNLHCGQTYTLNITAKGDNCSSPSHTTTFRTVPCEPTGLAVTTDCETNSAFVSWEHSEGAERYYVCAQPEIGDSLYCDNDGPFCTVEGLECGQVYNFSVEASDGVCNSSYSAPLQEGAAPCPPTAPNVKLQLIGQTEWARTSWEKVEDCPDVVYLVEITGRINDDPEAMMEVSSYWLPRPYFEFPMPCSTTFNITVRSRNSGGVSEPSAAFTGVTAVCSSNVSNVEGSGTRRRRDLRATKVYGHLHNSLEIPTFLKFEVRGVSLDVMWSKVKHATEYTIVIQEEQNPQEPPTVRSVEDDFHTETGLKPWTTYSVRLRAKNTTSRSDYTTPVIISTGSSR